MKFTLSSTALNSRLQTLAKVINSKNTMPVLDDFLFEVAEGTLCVTASDGENVMKSSMRLDESDGDGRIAVPNRTILEAVKELPEQPLTFSIDTESYAVTVNYQNGVYNFTGENADEYPATPAMGDDSTAITADGGTIADAIGRSLFATAQDELRPVMNGVYFDLLPDCLAIVSSDGHKLVRNKILTVHSDEHVSFILPKKPASLLRNVLSKDTGDVTIRVSSQNAEIVFPEGSLRCRLIEGRYPNYNSVIPQDNPNTLTIDRKAFLSAIRRVLPFASESSQLIRLHLEAGNIEISSEDIDFNTSAKENIICDYNGQVMDIGLKGSSLTEILGNLTSDDIIMQLADPSRPGVIIPSVQPENQDVLMLIMPMLLNE